MAGRPDPRSGLVEDGVWTPAFEGQRPPLEPGHELTVRHELVSRYRASDEPMVSCSR
jgi:hypothetical protein